MAEEKTGQVKLNQVCQTIFGITPRWYRELAKEGHVPYPIDGKIDFLPAIKQLIEYYRKQAEGGASLSLQEEKRLKVQVERKLKEITLLVETRELIPRSEILNEFSQRINAVKSGLIIFYRSLPPLLVGKDARQMSEIIKAQVFHLLDKFSREGKWLKRGDSNPNQKQFMVAGRT